MSHDTSNEKHGSKATDTPTGAARSESEAQVLRRWCSTDSDLNPARSWREAWADDEFATATMSDDSDESDETKVRRKSSDLPPVLEEDAVPEERMPSTVRPPKRRTKPVTKRDKQLENKRKKIKEKPDDDLLFPIPTDKSGSKTDRRDRSQQPRQRVEPRRPPLECVVAVDADCEVGCRSYMEDALVALHDLNAIDQEVLDSALQPLSFFAVYDGHGGNQAAKLAQKQLHNILIRHLKMSDGDRLQECLEGSLQDIQSAFVNMVSPEAFAQGRVTPGSTAVCCLISKDTLVTSWLGDSEAWLFRAGQSVRLMDPHKPLRPDELKRIESLGGTVSRQVIGHKITDVIGRVQGQLSVSRAIGDLHLKPYVSSVPETTKTKLTGAEEFLVMASDGLWDVLDPDTVYKLITGHLSRVQRRLKKIAVTSGGAVTAPTYDTAAGYASADTTAANIINAKPKRFSPVQGTARCLIREALNRRSPDNISAVIVFFERAPLELPDRVSSRALVSSGGFFKTARIRQIFRLSRDI
ncbi:MAG: hypothetical protein KVP17_001066 [Porospora cf. gigantea B]|uniref:uncharacterized protein n=2 Tax=Porospora cf. gigantea B TaxID=2853592 RepID=UPI0035719371|nr:MAG: hypothetical protein KVP17_001066 [Porospora cf. gigantea B]